LNDDQEVTVDVSTAKKEGHTINLVLDHEIVLKQSDRLRLRYNYEEVKRVNDSHIISYRMPTKNPRVEVQVCDGVQYEVGFANRLEAKRDTYPGVATLSGVLLPHQYIHVRWWDVAKAARFISPDAA
jgi:hypothetical protein